MASNSLWEQGTPTTNTTTSTLWDKATPVVKENITPTIPTPTLWDKGKPTKREKKPTWEAGASMAGPKSALQKVTEFAFGEGMATGEFERMTTLGQTLDLMGRTGYTMKSLINQSQQEINQAYRDAGLTEEEINSPWSVKKLDIQLKMKPKIQERFKAMWRGLTGHERVTANQLWDNVGIRGVPFLGFITEMALDPLMYQTVPLRTIATGGKATTKLVTGYEAMARGAGKVVGVGGKVAGKIPGVSNAIDFAVDSASELTNAARQMFITKSKIPELAAMIDKYLSRRQWLGGKGINFGVITRDAMQKEMKISGKKATEVEQAIVNIIEQPRKFKKLATPGEIAIAKAVQNKLEQTFTTMTDAGVPISSLGAARRARITELYGELETAVGVKKTALLQEIYEHKLAIDDEIIRFHGELHPLEVDVAHYSKNPNIVEWKVNKKTVQNDLGTDFGTESAALARQQDIGKGGGGKIYYPKLSPKRSIDATKIPMGEQLQYWDNPDDVLDFINKSGAISPDEYARLRDSIPRTEDLKFRQITTTPGKTKTKLLAQPTADEEFVAYLERFMKRKLTPEEMDAIPEVLQGKSIDIGNLRIDYAPKTNKYNIRQIISEAPIVGESKFLTNKFTDAQQDWYVGFRQLLLNKGYDSVKYFSLEDAVNPTYKILTGRIVGPAPKSAVARQAKVATMITAKEAEVTNLVNEAKEIYNLPVSEKRISVTANKLGVGKKEAKEIAQLQRARELGYFPRFTTKEAEGYLKNASKNKGMGARVWNPKIKNALRRKTSDFTLEEWNTFVAENGLEALGGNKIEEYFMRDPAYATALYQVRAAKAITSAEFIQDVVKTFGKTAKEALPKWEELPEAIQKLYPAAKGMKFDPEVMKEVIRVTEHYINPSSAGPVLKIIDGIQNSWRKWTLAPFPKYHLRNMVGNMWNNYLAGVDPDNYVRAQALQLYRKYRGTGKAGEKVALFELDRFKITPEIADTLISSAEEHGVLGRGWYGADIETGIRQQMGGGGLVQRGIAVGTTVENNARLAHFLDKLDKGADSMEAALSVKRYLFDYGDLTQFEREVMRRLFPFYTWSRKNIPLQLQELYKQPQKFAPLAIPFRLRNEEDLIKLKYARPDLYERLPLELQRTMDTVTYVPLEGLIPAGDLAKLVPKKGAPPWEGLQDSLFELLTPYIRAPLELKMNRSMYFESEIQKYDRETAEVWGFSLPVHLKYLLTTILPQARMISEIDRLVKKDKPDYTPQEFAFSQSLSSIYKVPLKELRSRALNTMEKKVDDLKRGLSMSKRRGRTAEYKRIKNTYEIIKEEVRKIKNW